MKIKLIILSAFCIFAFHVKSQKAYSIHKKQRNNYEAYPSPYNFKPQGWLFDAALTTTLSFNNESSTITTNDTSYTYTGPIRPGVTLNLGRYLSLKKGHKLIKYIDYSAGYKMLWNTETLEKINLSTHQSNKYSQNNTAHYLNLNLNFNNVISLDNYNFIQNSIGVNGDYRFFNKLSGEGINHTNEPHKFIVQVHYKLALGLMVDNNISVIPYIEVPVFNITPTQNKAHELDYFNQSYQTFIIGARVMLFRLGQKECPKARGVTVNPNQINGY